MAECIVTKSQKREGVQVQTKVMLIAFFDVHEIVHTEFSQQGQTINQHIYKSILQLLMHSEREKRRELWKRVQGCFTMTMLQPIMP